MRVIGIDPGLRCAGWGVIESDGVRIRHIANGLCRSDASAPLAARLEAVFRGLAEAIAAHRPTSAAVEQTFVNSDPAGALKLGQARGAAMVAAAAAGLPVAEYAPSAIKKAVVGGGGAAKAQVQHMLGVLLPGAQVAGPDAADALAIAICHAYRAEGADRLGAAIARAGAKKRA